VYKVINLKNDEIFRHAVKLNINRNMSNDKFQRAESVREAVCDLVVQGKLDAIDLKIIAAMDCSPLPTQESTAASIGISRTAVMKRVARFQRLLSST